MNEVSPEVLELVERGKVLYSVENYTEAITQLQQAVKLAPQYEPAYEHLGICYVMADMYAEAKATFNKYLLINKKSGLSYFHLGNIALLENNADEAKAMYSKAELLGYQNSVMYINLASYFEELGDYENALAQYTKLLRSNPYAYDIMGKKTQLFMRIGKFEEAFSSAKKMVQTDIERFEGHHYTYVALIMLKKYNEAQKYINDVIDRFPDNQTAIFDRVRLYDLTGETDKALELLERDYQDCDEIGQVALLKLGLLMQKERYDEAIALVEKSKLLQQDENALTLIYSLYFGKGEYNKALEYCDKIQSLGKENSQYYASWYFKALAKLKSGDQKQAMQGFEKASADLRGICIAQPERIDLNMYRILCEYQLGHLDEAKKIAEFLVAVQPNEAVFHLALAIVLEAQGDKQRAEECRSRARELDPNVIAPLV